MLVTFNSHIEGFFVCKANIIKEGIVFFNFCRIVTELLAIFEYYMQKAQYSYEALYELLISVMTVETNHYGWTQIGNVEVIDGYAQYLLRTFLAFKCSVSTEPYTLFSRIDCATVANRLKCPSLFNIVSARYVIASCLDIQLFFDKPRYTL